MDDVTHVRSWRSSSGAWGQGPQQRSCVEAAPGFGAEPQAPRPPPPGFGPYREQIPFLLDIPHCFVHALPVPVVNVFGIRSFFYNPPRITFAPLGHFFLQFWKLRTKLISTPQPKSAELCVNIHAHCKKDRNSNAPKNQSTKLSSLELNQCTIFERSVHC